MPIKDLRATMGSKRETFQFPFKTANKATPGNSFPLTGGEGMREDRLSTSNYEPQPGT